MIHHSWNLKEYFGTEEFISNKKYILSNQKIILPSLDNIFKAFEMPVEKVKLVIIGQSPYPSKEHANGIAFSSSAKLPPYSLRIINNEIIRIRNQVYGNTYKTIPIDYTLKSWTDQGILLLNSSLTTIVGETDCHYEKWVELHRHIANKLNINIPILFVGSKAQELINTVYINFKTERCRHPASVKYGYSFSLIKLYTLCVNNNIDFKKL